MAQVQLWVDNEDSTGAWSTVGTTPYIDTQNEPTAYIYSTGRNSLSGVFSFQTTGVGGTINWVRLYIYAYGVATSDFEAYLGATATGLGPPAGSWQWVYVDVSSILTSWSAINSATTYFDRPNTQNDAGVDACYILVDYTGAPQPSVSDSATVGDTPIIAPMTGQAVRSESVTVGDTPSAYMSLASFISSGATVTDAPTAEVVSGAPEDREISKLESVGVSDSPLGFISLPSLSASDNINVADQPYLIEGCYFIVSDAISAIDSVILALSIMAIGANDGISISDTPNANIPGEAGPTLTISVTEEDPAYWIYAPVIIGG